MKKNLIYNALHLSGSQFIVYGLQAIITLYLIKILDFYNYGIIAFSQAFIATSIVLLDLGFSISATNKVALFKNNKNYINKLNASIFQVKTILFLILLFFTLIFFKFFSKLLIYEEVIYLSLISIYVISIIPTWFFYGIEDIKSYSLFLLFSKFAYLVLIFLFVRDSSDYIYIPILYCIGFSILAFFSFYKFHKLGYKILYFANFKFILYALRFTVRFFASRLAVAFNVNAAILIMGSILSPSLVAIYSLGDQIYRVMQTLVGSISVTLYPYMSNSKNIYLMKKLLILIFPVITFSCIIVFFYTPLIIDLFFDEVPSKLIDVIRIFIFVFYFNSLNVLMGYPLFAALNTLKVANSSLFMGSLLYLSFLLFFYFNGESNINFFIYALLISEIYILLHRFFFFYMIDLKK